jgi:predicted RNA binding protein YcfA (HicA-like mRNA interferase family)
VKVPRDLSGAELVKLLRLFGYVTVRQTGSHIRLRTESTGIEHLITIPNHNPMRLGTVQSILNDVAKHLNMSKQDLIERLFS